MRIKQLEAFLSVVEMGNFGLAANRCKVTQSTISRQIQALENDLGLSLFHRTSQAKLTVAGEKLLPHAKKIHQEWSTAIAEVRNLKQGKQPELCIAALHSACAHFLPPVLQQFCREYPDIQLRVTALGSDRAMKVLRDGLVDLAIIMGSRFMGMSSEMVLEPLYEEPIEVLMAANHPLTQYSAVPHSEIGHYPQVIFKDGYGMQRLIQAWSNEHNVRLNPIMELNTLGAFRGVVRQGEVIALLPQSALLEARQDSQLAVRSLGTCPDSPSTNHLNPSLSRQVVLVTTRDRLQIPSIAHFCQLVRQSVQPLVSITGDQLQAS